MAELRPGAALRLTFMGLVGLVMVCPVSRAESYVFAQAAPAAEWRQATGPRVWTFPRDHGAHPQYRTEWWYFTGNLADPTGRRYGYQLTFFRQGIRWMAADGSNPWSVRDLYLAHFTTTDIPARQFHWAERASRAGPGLAGASTDGMDVWVLNWSARMDGTSIMLDARNQQMELHLHLTPKKPLVTHGENGFSKKGPAEGQASYYVSYTDLATQGTIRTRPDDREIAVKGTSWFDHEFGSNQLSGTQQGWDWFGLHLSDGRDLMIYLLRLKDGSIEPSSSGTLIEPDGTSRHLALEDIQVSIMGKWRSPRSEGNYPSRWRIHIPSAGIEMNITPLLADQELNTQGSTGVVYWEGAVEGFGTSGKKTVSCQGYVELTGYSEGLGGVF